jgi:hypothetical protein
MYKVFKLPYDFLNQKYTKEQTDKWDNDINNFCSGQKGQLTEELNKQQKRKVDSWYGPDRESREAHEQAFPKGEDRTSIPFVPSDEKMDHNHPAIRTTVHAPLVAGALHKAGYHITDYAKGLAIKLPKEGEKPDAREHSIGKILNSEHGKAKTYLESKPRYKIDPETKSFAKDEHGNKIVERPARAMTVADVFGADPLRSGSTKKTSITFTKNKYDVAGMSTDRGWSSCMNMEDGINRHYLPHDISHGTITAYHTEHSDDGIKNPIGRINLKKFTGTNSGHVIYRPENSEYGAKVPGFKDQVHKWAEEKFPMKSSEAAYVKAPELYNDDGKSFLHNPNADQSASSDHQLHKATNDAIRHQFRAAEEAADAHYEKHGFHNGAFSARSEAPKTVKNLMPSDGTKAASVAFHGIHELSDANNDDNQEPHWQERNSEDHYHRKALDRYAQARNLSDEDLAHHVRKFNTSFGEHDADESYNQVAQQAHADLHDELFHPRRMGSKSLDAVRDETIIHHLNNPDYHEHLAVHHNGSAFDDTSDLPQLTKNPRIIHNILENHRASDRNEEVNVNPENWRHAGEHADEKLAHFVATKKYDNEDEEDHHRRNREFVKGLNKNPNGEAIQHALTSQMYLGGGHSDHGALHDIKSAQRANDVIKGHDSYLRDDPHSDELHNSVFHAIAQHSAFPSVRDKLRNRHDVPDELKKDIQEGTKVYFKKTLREIRMS